MLRGTRLLVLTGMIAVCSLPYLGCAKSDLPGKTAPINETLADDATTITADAAIAANRDFAVDLYRQLARERPGQNLFFSPFSVSGALIIALEGARGETAAQMGAGLRFPDAVRRVDNEGGSKPWDTAQIHAEMSQLNQRFRTKPAAQELLDQIAGLRKDLQAAERQTVELRKTERFKEAAQAYAQAQKLVAELNTKLARVDQYEIRVANALWGEKSHPFEPSYLETIQHFYGPGAVFPVDFRNDAEAARQQINAWADDQSRGRIRELIPPSGVDRATRLVLANAIYFKGAWTKPFPEGSTKDDEFTLAGGDKIRVPTMHEDYRQEVRYAAFDGDGTFFATPNEVPARRVPDPKTVYPGDDGFLMLELPYKGGDLSMVIIVPQSADRLERLEEKLSGEELQKWLGRLEHRNVHVYLPKFKLGTDYDLKDTLSALGMSRAFEKPSAPQGAQFEGMCAIDDPDERLFISDVRHKAFVEVSEKGTEAVAVTLLNMTVEDGSFDDPVTEPFTPTFRANKPFLFLIRDIKTGTVLFLGRIVRPQE